MEKSKVYYTDFHTRKLGEGLPTKLQLLAKKAGIANLNLMESLSQSKCILEN